MKFKENEESNWRHNKEALLDYLECPLVLFKNCWVSLIVTLPENHLHFN